MSHLVKCSHGHVESGGKELSNFFRNWFKEEKGSCVEGEGIGVIWIWWLAICKYIINK